MKRLWIAALSLCFATSLAAAAITEILGRPTDHSISISVALDAPGEMYVEFGTASGAYVRSTEKVQGADLPATIVLTALDADTRYYYRLRYRSSGASAFASGEEHTFLTQRSRGSTFVFTVQADSHLGTEKHCNVDLYARTLSNALKDGPDFHIDLGDTFRADHINVVNPQTVAELYANQRAFFGLLCHSAPLYLVTGNHEVASAWLLDGTPDNVAIWAVQSRQRHFLNPTPDGFYSGDSNESPYVGLPQDYFAWEWGDALFVAIDPYWHTKTDPRASGDQWDWTLGEAQYRWLERTLSGSTAKYKFVFAHHVQGDGSRGGIEPAKLYEWGGYDRNGAFMFGTRRPSWPLPIHQMMVRYGVTMFVQGHDHLFARQELDGIVYQTCPMPGDWTYSTYNADAFESGVTLPNSGHLRFTVTPGGVRADYVRAFLPSDEINGHANGEVAYSYTIGAPRSARQRAIRR